MNQIPRWVPPLVFLLVTIIFFREFVLTGARLLGTDTVALSYFARSFFTNFVHAFHRFPLWDPLLYGGLPFIDGMHGDIFYPPSLALVFLNAERMWGWKLVLHVFLAGVFCYLWLRELGLARGSALLGGLVFMLGADLISLTYPGGDGKLFVSALAPLAFLLTERAVRLRRARDYAAFSLGIALVMFTSHMQAAYFLVWGVTLYFIFRLLQTWRVGNLRGRGAAGNFAAFALAGILGVGAAAIQFFPPLDYLRNWSHRASRTEQARTPAEAYQYSTSYSLHPEEIMSLVVPEFVGDHVPDDTGTGMTYWGKNPIKLNSEYAGLIGLLLLPVLLIRRRRARSWFFLGLGALALIYALGADSPAFRLFYLIPGVKLFRAPSIIIFLYGLSVATLAALAFERIAEAPREMPEESGAVRRTLWIGVGVIGFLAILASSGILMAVWQSVFHSQMNENQAAALQNNLPNITTGFWLTFAVAIAIAITIEGFLRGFWSVRAALVALCVISLLDLARAGRPFVRGTVLMNQVTDPTLFTADESIGFLRERQAAGEVFRAFDLSNIARMENPGYPDNALAIHGIEQLAGHHGNEIGRYRELIGGDRPYALLSGDLQLFDLTNTTYVLVPALVELPGFKEVFRGSRTVVYQKPDVLPRAYLVGEVEVVADSAAVKRLLSADFDFRRKVMLPESLPAGIAIQADPQGTVQWSKREPDAVSLRVTSDRPALLMVLDNYYKAWRAEVNGANTPILRANHTFRAVPLPAGEHEVKFIYDIGYLKGPALASALLLILLAAVAFGSPLLDRLRARRAA
ncbi:MAG: hypothetical protein ACT4O1_13980 [Gemmatimonadota bacterium]